MAQSFAFIQKNAKFAVVSTPRRQRPAITKNNLWQRKKVRLVTKNIVMATIQTKHFQYTGTDDFDATIDVQINEFIKEEGLSETDVVDVKYEGHSALGVNTYSALLVYKKD